MELNEIDKFSMEADKNAKLYMEHTKLWHDKHILVRNFELENHVLLYTILDKVILK